MTESEKETCEVAQFYLGKSLCDVQLDTSNTTLQWTHSKGKKSTDVKRVSLSDVIGATSKDGNSWTIHYITKHSDKWKSKHVKFTGQQDDVCQHWADAVNDAISKAFSDRPKRPLVFINPDAGRKMGVKNYQTKVAPLFEKAGVQAEVIVTKDGNHAASVIAEYDLSTIDSMVAVGGDGTLIKVISALESRMMKDEGRDMDDPDGEPLVTQIPVGIIPSGSAQGMIKLLSGIETTNIVTAALLIVLGYTSHTNLLSVYNNRRFVGHGLLFGAYGLFADAIVTSEKHRRLGPFRYLHAGMKHIMRPRAFDATAYYQPEDSADKNEWLPVSGRYTVLNMSIHRLLEGGNNSCLQGPSMLFTLDASAGRRGLFKLIYHMAKLRADTYQQTGITAKDTDVVRYELPSVSRPKYQHVLNIDGEAVLVEAGEILIRNHRKCARVFGQIRDYIPGQTR